MVARAVANALIPLLVVACRTQANPTADAALAFHIEPQPGCQVKVALLVQDDGIWVGAMPGTSAFVRDCSGGRDGAAVAEALCELRKGPTADCADAIEVAGRPTALYGDVMAAIDLSSVAGFPDVRYVDDAALPIVFPPAEAKTAAVPRCGQKPEVCSARGVVRPLIGVTIPTDEKKLALTPLLTIDAHDVRLDGQVVALASDLEKDEPLAGLYAALAAKAKAFGELTLDDETKAALRGVLRVRADDAVRIGGLNKALEEAHRAGYMDVLFEGHTR